MTAPQIRETLFEMAANNGTQFSFAFLVDDRCAILRDGEIVGVHDSDDASMEDAVKEYFAMVDASGGARHPFQVVDASSQMAE